MSLHLWYANHLERLADILAYLIRDERPVHEASALFQPVRIVVSHPLLETWLRLGLAKRHGIAAHLQCEGLLDFLEGVIPRSLGVQRLDEDALTSLLLSIFSRPESLNHPELEPLQRYVGSGEPDSKANVHFARHMAELFVAYAFERPAMLSLWQQPQGFSLGLEHQSVERWQRRLYLTLREDVAALSAKLISLPEMLRAFPLAKLEVPKQVHVFGLSYISSAFREIFGALAKRCELHIYSLNPCMEFWEDVDTSVENSRALRRRFQEDLPSLSIPSSGVGDVDLDAEDPFGLDTRGDTPALRLWGRPGRENIRLLNALTECDFRPFFFDPLEDGSTLLNHLKRDILVREPERATPETHLHLEPDESLRFLRCPSIQSEVEAVASHIWELVTESSLRWGDVAVIVNAPQADAYLARIGSVFTEAYNIPHVLLELDLSRSSRFVEATERLLALPFSDFTREEVLTFITHPHVTHALGGGIEIELWQHWCDALGIVHGADHDAHLDTYIQHDLYNWEQGLKRLALGLFMAEPDGGGLIPPIPLGNHSYIPLPLPPDQLDDAAHFILLMRSLIADTRFAQRGSGSLTDWTRFMIGLITAYLEPESTDDIRARHDILECFESLTALDFTGRPVPYRVAYELAQTRLAQLKTGRGQPLTDGVLVASVDTMRPLPFEAVFMIGMGEGLFPNSSPVSPLDLRRYARRVGDVSERERDAWTFLDTLVQTRARLYLSHVWRDPKTGEEQAPASVVDELMSIVRRGYVDVERMPELIEHHPMTRHDRRYFPLLRSHDDNDDDDARERAHQKKNLVSHIPEARREAQIAALRNHFEHVTGTAFERRIDPAELRQMMDPEAFRDLMHRLAIPHIPKDDTGRFDPGQAVDVSMAALRHFLRSPLQGSARHVLGMRSSAYTDIMSREDEFFEAPFRNMSTVLSEIFVEALGGHSMLSRQQLDERYKQRATLEELAGRYPTGPFARAQSHRDLGVLQAWVHHINALELGHTRSFHRLRFGQMDRGSHNDAHIEERLPPLELGGIVVPSMDPKANAPSLITVRLHGTTSLLDRSRHTAMWMNTAPVATEKHLLSGFLDHMVLTASGTLTHADDFQVIVVPGTRAQPAQRLLLQPLSAHDAKRYLTLLITEFLSGHHDYILPIEAVLSARLAQPPKPVADSVRKLLDNAFAACSTRYGPVRRLSVLGPPPDAEAIAERRFGPLLRGLLRRQ